jgi:hypothetical protein
MKTLINIDNYEEIMFRLLEVDFDQPTRADLLQQIEKDELFKFEWESWQKTKFVDSLENYVAESTELTEKIILIAGPRTAGRKRFFYYWAAAASLILLIGTLFLLTSDFTSRPKPEVVETVKKSPFPVKNDISPVQSQSSPIVVSDQKQFRSQKAEKQTKHVVIDSISILPVENTLVEIPLLLDSVPVKADELAKAPEKKPRYTITVENSDIFANNLNNIDLSQNRKVQISKLFKNTRLFLQRKENGEPDKIILMGDENNYLCINLNYSEK